MSQPKARTGPSIVLVVVSILLVILGFYTLQLGIFNLDGGRVELAALYFFVAIMSLGFVSFSVMRVRRGYSASYLAPIKVLSIVRCPQCSFKQIKNFAIGDYVFKTAGKCSQCGTGELFINGIYTEGLGRR